MLVQRITFDGKSGFHDLTLYRISDKDRYLITRFTCESDDDWNKDVYPSNVSCENCGHSYEIRVACSDCKNLDQISMVWDRAVPDVSSKNDSMSCYKIIIKQTV